MKVCEKLSDVKRERLHIIERNEISFLIKLYNNIWEVFI